MLTIVLKLALAAAIVTVGLWFWRRANKWQAQGEIPKEAVEAVEPRPVLSSDKGFRTAIAWERAMAVLIWVFAALMGLSVVFQLLGKLP
jgi:hypothetical protein